jgi:two-component system sensor histidine kinase MprB
MSIVSPVRRRVGHSYQRWHSAPIRTRLTVAAAAAATLTIVAVVVVAYVAVHHELLGSIDSQLRKQANEVNLVESQNPFNGDRLVMLPRANEVEGDLQLVGATTAEGAAHTAYALPVSSRDRTIAANGGTWLRTMSDHGTPLRVYTAQSRQYPNVAVQIALPLTATQNQLHKLTLAFLILVLAGFGLVSAGTWFAIRRMLRPVVSLTDAAEQIAVTRDLTTRISTYSDDELGRLARSFNTMLDALERSLGQQRQLILDASHELRTPLASLRTNVEVLHDLDRLAPDQRRSLLDGIVTQLDELTGLVADVVELARGDAPESAQDDVSFDELVSHAVDRARRHWPQVVFMLEAQPCMVRGGPGRLNRAVANLLDNAGKFSSPGSVVDVSLSASGELTVTDRGPGIPEVALPHVFDRFYRADEARALPGSGLGLAIVKQVVDGHGGSVTVANRPAGGAVVTMRLTALPREDAVPMVETVASQPVGG